MRIGGRVGAMAAGTVLAGLAPAALGYEPLFESLDDSLPPCVNEIVVTNANPSAATDADRLFVEFFNADESGGTAYITLVWDDDTNVKPANESDYGRVMDLPVAGCHSETFDDKHAVRPGKRLDKVVFTLEGGESRRFKVRRLAWLSPGETVQTDESSKVDPRARAARKAALSSFRQQCTRGAFVIGQASAAENVPPRGDFPFAPADRVSVRLAQNEYESMQILVSPAAEALRNVRVSVKMDCADFGATNISCAVVGYVKPRITANHRVGYTVPTDKFPFYRREVKRLTREWWPDPILDFQHEADISPGDVQSFWVRVHAPEGQRPGVYGGSLIVSADGAASVSIPLSVRVNAFALPRHALLPIAVDNYRAGGHCGYGLGKTAYNELVRKPASDPADGLWTACSRRSEDYRRFFADYLIPRDGLYIGKGRSNGNARPHFDALKKLKAEGRLGPFNLGYFSPCPGDEAGMAKWKKNHLPRLKDAYDKAKELGILDKAYLYGCDEENPPTFPDMARAIAILHENFPGVKVGHTARNWNGPEAYGCGESPLKDTDFFVVSLDAWPWRPKEREQARLRGAEAWWYVCFAPRAPWPNCFLGCPPIELRYLVGAMAHKFGCDGFLYYATMIWNNVRPIEKGPFTDWNPCTYARTPGDGQWTCAGPDGLPLATLRLENFRDGLEDYAYAKLLEEKLRIRGTGTGERGTEEWICRAKAALEVPPDVMVSLTQFTTAPQPLYRWRDKLADLIEEAK